MAKQIEPYEEDDFLLEDQQNSTEEQTIEEEDEAEEESSFKLRPRPARASLTHNAIKSELLKMKKQDSGDDNEENLSRSARKRKKRREKLLEERRASGGRGENFEDDLAHFKSIPISRRRSSVLPLNQNISLPSNHNNGDGFCSQLKCCLWIVLVVATLIGLIYVWPTVAELDYEVAEQLANPQPQSQLQPEQMGSNEIDEGERIINSLNKLSAELDENQEGEQQDENNEGTNAEIDEESLGTFDYISSFFATETPPTTETVEQPDEPGEDLNEPLNEPDVQEDNGETATTNDDQADEGFDEQATDEDDQANGEDEEILSSQVPERYQSAVHQDNVDEEEESGCMIGGQIYSNLNEDQCSVLQHQLENQLRQQEQLKQEQQANENNEEQFYFF